MPFELPELPYEYNALEPHIDEQTMRIHHGKHHQGYVNKLSAALEGHSDLEEKSVEELLSNLSSLPEGIRLSVQNNGGGHLNHSLFWPSMSPEGGGEPEGELANAIASEFESFTSFREEFSNAALSVFGSGWAWLVRDSSGKVLIATTPNQDSPVSQGLTPLLGIDVWEHAYYLRYFNKRDEYIRNWWEVVNWKQVEENYSKALGE